MLSTLSPSTRGMIYILIGTACFSTKAILVKLAYRYPVDAVTLLTLRMGISLPIYLIIGFFVFRSATTRSLPWADHMRVMGYGFAGYYLASLFDLMGLQYISAGLERLILYLYPTIVLLMSAVFFKRSIGKREWLALVFGYGGILLVYINDASVMSEHALLGMGLIFLCAVSFAIYIVGSGQMIPRMGAMSFTVYAMTIACMAILIHFFLTRPLVLLWVQWELWLISTAIALFCTVLPTFLMAWGIKLLGAPKASLLGTVGPIFTIALAYFVLGESFTWIHALSTMMVIVAVSVIGKNKST